jgi:hypothetical protein
MRYACVSISVSSVKKTHLTFETLTSTLTSTSNVSQDASHCVSMKYSHRMTFKCIMLYEYPRMVSNGLEQSRNSSQMEEKDEIWGCHGRHVYLLRSYAIDQGVYPACNRNRGAGMFTYSAQHNLGCGAHFESGRADLTRLDSPFRTPRIAPRFDFICNL